MTETTENGSDLIAAIDLGSNSFHMIVAQECQDAFRILEKRGSKVQLAAGLDDQNMLSSAAMQRGIDCLREFAPFLKGMDPRRVSVLATNALRQAHNRQDFIDQAEGILGFPIEVIAGREEARLIYLGVAHSLIGEAGKRLVVDIGGGSTEFIVGEGFEPQALESLRMGCVSYTKQFFPDGLITEARFNEAVASACQQLQTIQSHYQALGWQCALGSSGTIRAAAQTLLEYGWEVSGISIASMYKLRETLLQLHCTDDINLPGVKHERRQVFIGGFAILQAVFETFQIERMHYSDGALREGTLWDMVGRTAYEHVCAASLKELSDRYDVDVEQARRVEKTTLELFAQVYKEWHLDSGDKQLLGWAAQLHEIGLCISHSGFHKHGGYVLEHSDLLGFTRQRQAKLATLVRTHRRHIHPEYFDSVVPSTHVHLKRLMRILRIAATLHKAHGAHNIPTPEVTVIGDEMHLVMPTDWLRQHPLTARDLNDEIHMLQQIGYTLTVT